MAVVGGSLRKGFDLGVVFWNLSAFFGFSHARNAKECQEMPRRYPYRPPKRPKSAQRRSGKVRGVWGGGTPPARNAKRCQGDAHRCPQSDPKVPRGGPGGGHMAPKSGPEAPRGGSRRHQIASRRTSKIRPVLRVSNVSYLQVFRSHFGIQNRSKM